MKTCRILAAALALTVIFANPAHAVKKEEAKGALFAASDGAGAVTLVWYPAYGKWPAGGWRLTDSKGATVAEKVSALDDAAVAALPADDSDGLKKLVDALSTAADKDELSAAYFNLGLIALTDIDRARALGLAYTLGAAGKGKRSYKAAALDGSGKVMYTLVSAEVDPARATPVPPGPGELRAQAGETGTELYWRPAPRDRTMPVMAYAIERDWAGQNGAALTEEPLFMGADWDDAEPAFIDADAPVEQELTYRVYGLDVFGRQSEPSEATVFMPDFRALYPPDEIVAEAGEGTVKLSWRPNDSPYTAGYMVERSFTDSGVYEMLTPSGLSPDADAYEDRGLMGGSFQYYRIRSIGPGGRVGEPSLPVMASPLTEGRPDSPEGLRADTGPTRVRLTWDKPGTRVAGYIVERKGEGSSRWAMLNSSISPEPRYDDSFNLGEHGTYSYRVTAVGFDSRQSSPSREVEVTLEDTSPPPAPHMSSIDGTGGVVKIGFSPGVPEEKTVGFLVLRGTSAHDAGLVIGDPLPASARGYTDEYVKPGEDYWYAVVATGANGKRSVISERLMVLAGTPDIPEGPVPEAIFVEEPFRHVALSFGAVPEGFSATVQYAASGTGPWTMLAQGITGEGISVHTGLPDTDMLYYRVVYKAANGVQGRPSAAVGIDIKQGQD